MSAHRQLESIHRALHFAGLLVPRIQRETWRAEWAGELSYAYRESPQAAQELASGLFADAIAVRRIAIERRIEAIDWRAPDLCIRVLIVCLTALLIITIAQPHIRHIVLSRWGGATFASFVILAVFSVPATVATSRYGACEAYHGDAATAYQRIIRWRFLATKFVLVVFCGYLLAVQVTLPAISMMGSMANWLMIACGILFNVIGMSWVFTDQRQRCPTCMRLLRSPARMGQPSWSLLDSNATEEMCDRGHGLLHQPEWQTSWFENARWLQLDRTWRELFRP
jgi:hypothetical protein